MDFYVNVQINNSTIKITRRHAGTRAGGHAGGDRLWGDGGGGGGGGAGVGGGGGASVQGTHSLCSFRSFGAHGGLQSPEGWNHMATQNNIKPVETETPNPDLQEHARSSPRKYRSDIEAKIPNHAEPESIEAKPILVPKLLISSTTAVSSSAEESERRVLRGRQASFRGNHLSNTTCLT